MNPNELPPAQQPQATQPDDQADVTRRRFLQTAGAATAVASVGASAL